MKNAAFLTLLSPLMLIFGLEINQTHVNYAEPITVELNALKEHVLIYENSSSINPHTVRAWSSDATKSFPILVVVRQAKQVSSWTVPEILETSEDNTLLFYNTSKTLCHDDMDNINNQHNSVFPIGPLIISQSFIVALSTSSVNTVSVTIVLEEEKSFFIETETNYTLLVSPSQSRYMFFSFETNNASDTVVVVVESLDDVCLTVSIQDSRCPVRDSNKDIKYEGTYQTVNKKGAITIAKSSYPTGFFLVFVAKPDDYECNQESSVIPFAKYSTVMENNVVSNVTFLIKNSISIKEYIIACLGTLATVTIFGVLFTGIIFIFNRFGTISKANYESINIRDVIEKPTDDEIDNIIRSPGLTVNYLAKHPTRIKQRSFNYFSHTASIALFYSIPVIQLVVTYQRVVNLTGNQDVCYYNFLCAHPAFVFSDFNHIFSNVGYVFIGIFFIFAVLDRQRRIKITKDKGIPVHYGLFYAMGLALTIEGLLSACYHICPSQSNYQFDTSFMYVMAVLMMIKLYQNRHPDINATAYSTFSIVGLAIFIAMLGILDGTLFIWIIFLLGYGTLIIVLSLKIYYLNYVVHGLKLVYKEYQVEGISKEIFVPIKKRRLIVVCIANIANFAILGAGLYVYIGNLTDFGTYLLGLLMANTVLHISFYTFMKILHHERISFESIIFGFLGLCCWIASGIFFLDAATLWTVTPAESRQWNQGCIFLGFYDKHDVWHLLSAPALYFTFLYLMYLDDDLCDKPQNEIPVF